MSEAVPVRRVAQRVEPATGAGRQAHGNRLVGLLPSSGAVLLWAVVAVVAVTFSALLHSGLYLTSDGGHYLADANTIAGHGVRDLRHLPVFPGLLLVVHVIVRDDLLALNVAMGLVMVALAGAFYVFIRGRTGNRWAEVAGTALFALSPILAEGIAWYGASMMLGVAFSIAAMRFIDDALTAPRLRPVLLAGASCALVALTHPFSLLFLFEACAVAIAIRVVAAVVLHRRSALAVQAVAARLGICVAIVACVGTAVLLGSSFYTSAENPVSISVDFSRLQLLINWALRDDTALWLILLGAVLLLLPAGWYLARERGLNLSIWITAVAAVSLGNVVLMSGPGDYITRNFYPLPLVFGATFAILVAVVVKATRTLAARRSVLRTALVALPVVVTLPIASHAYVTHLAVAVPYYNTVTSAEYNAITWFRGKQGTVVLTQKGDNIDDGTLYSWMIEGLDNVRAIGTGSDSINLLAEAIVETRAAVRVINGDTSTARAQDVRYLFTWRQSGLVDTVSARPCYQTAYANAEVVIFSVDPWHC